MKNAWNGVEWIKELKNILNLPMYSNWALESVDEEGWYGVDEWDVNVFLLADYCDDVNIAKKYKYGIDMYTCELDKDGYVNTRSHIGTLYVVGDKLTDQDFLVKYDITGKYVKPSKDQCSCGYTSGWNNPFDIHCPYGNQIANHPNYKTGGK